MVIFMPDCDILMERELTMKPNIFKYMDYRQYLIDFYFYGKAEFSYFSYQYIAQKVLIDTSNLAKVFQKKRHLPKKSVRGFKVAFQLDDREFEYFEVLVEIAKVKKEDIRQKLFNKLLHIQESQPRFMGMNEYHFYSQWYHTAIYGLLDCFKFSGNYKELAEMLSPAISVREAKESISLLLKLGLIKKNSARRYIPTEKVISTGDQWKSLAIKNFQKKTMELGIRALDKISKEKRDITTLTFSVTADELAKLKELNLEYRKKVISLISRADNGDIVYQLNTQLFPMSIKS